MEGWGGIRDIERVDLSEVEEGTSVTWRGGIRDIERVDLSDVEGGTSVTWRGGGHQRHGEGGPQ